MLTAVSVEAATALNLPYSAHRHLCVSVFVQYCNMRFDRAQSLSATQRLVLVHAQSQDPGTPGRYVA